MDRVLIEKIIGKKHYVELNDEIFNLRNISYKIRESILLKIELKEEFIKTSSNKINNSNKIIINIIDFLESDNIKGYTNSKIYLVKYLRDICRNLEGILNSIDKVNYDELLIYTNSLIDLILLF